MDPTVGAIRGLVAFDLDGTLLRGPTVCELLAERLGRLPRMRELEASSSPADIARARAEMAGWYRDVPRADLLAALGAARWAPGAREGTALLRESGVTVAIASITWEFAARWIADELGVVRVLGTRLAPDGRIGHVWPAHKARWLEDLAAELRVPEGRTAAVGDSPSDADLLSAASLRFYVGAGPPPALPGVVHRPGADIATIARELLGAWGGGAAR